MLRDINSKILFSIVSLSFATSLFGCHGSGGSSGGASPAGTNASVIMTGQVNPAFGTAGYASTVFGTTSTASGMGVQSTGSTVFLFQSASTATSFYLTRFTPAGATDTTFGFSGQSQFQCSFNCVGSNLIVQSDDQILVINSTQLSGSGFFSVVRYTAQGILDTTYGNNGVTVTSNGSVSSAYIDPSTDDLVITGNVVSPASTFVERFLPTGVLDTGFNTTGILSISNIPGYSGTPSITTSIYNNLTLEYLTAATIGSNYFLGQITIAGTIDSTFGTSGLVNSSSLGSVTALAVQSNGDIIIGSSSAGNIQISRLLPNGQFDSTFGTAGSFSFPSGDTAVGTVSNLFVDQLGNILIVYNATTLVAPSVTPQTNLSIFRLTPAGATDTSFGTAGSLSLLGEASSGAALINGIDMALSVSGIGGAQIVQIY